MALVGFLDTVTNLILDNYPTYKAWAEAIAFYLLANGCYKVYLPGGGRGIPLTFNPWVIGPSRLSFKSTAASIVKPILKKCNIHIETDYTTEKFTSIAQKMAAENPDGFHCAIVRDETSGLIDEGNKRYKAGGLAFLCKVLDGEVPGRNTFSHGLEEDLPARVNFITACTPQVFSMIDEGFWTQGLGNRLVPIYITEKIFDDMYSCPHKLDSTYYEVGLRNSIESLLKHMKTNIEKISYPKDVDNRVTFEEFRRRTEGYKKYFKDIWSIVPSYEYECQVNIQKVAALKAIDRQPSEKYPEVSMADYEYATKWIGERFEEFLIMYEKWKECKRRSLMNTRKLSIEEKIFGYVERHGRITLTELNNNINGESGEKKKVLEDMTDVGKLKADQDGRKTIWRLPQGAE